MMFYNMELDDKSKELATIVTPFGKFQYCRLAMGLKTAPDEAQALIDEILGDLNCERCIDDIGIMHQDYDEHMKVLQQVLTRLQEHGLKVNPVKCEWCVKETNFLGHWLTPTGIKPWQKKIDAILRLSPPKDKTQLKSFLGAVTYYHTMWPRRSRVLHPLTKLTGNVPYEWKPKHQKAFEEMKAVMAAEALTAYPNHNLPFQIYTDANNYQMGAIINQNGRIVA